MTPQEIDAEAKKAIFRLTEKQIARHRAVLLAALLNIRSFTPSCEHDQPKEHCPYCQLSEAITAVEIHDPPPEPPPFKCPKCGAEINHVEVYSRFFQKATLRGNETVDYTSPDFIETDYINCPQCGEEITSEIKEC